MQSIVPSISRAGVPIQWSADLTEHAHIQQIKDPARGSNNNNYDPQICRQLDCLEKCRNFNLALSLKNPVLWRDVTDATGESDDEESNLPVSLHSITDYFSWSHQLASSPPDTVPLPLCAFSLGCIAFNLAYDLHIRHISMDQAAEQFGLPDLRVALADFLSFEKSHGVESVHPIGGGPRRAPTNTELPFTDIHHRNSEKMITKGRLDNPL